MLHSMKALYSEWFQQLNTPVTMTMRDPAIMMKNCTVSIYITAARPPIAEQMYVRHSSNKMLYHMFQPTACCMKREPL